jgi:hypothetical protein
MQHCRKVHNTVEVQSPGSQSNPDCNSSPYLCNIYLIVILFFTSRSLKQLIAFSSSDYNFTYISASCYAFLLLHYNFNNICWEENCRNPNYVILTGNLLLRFLWLSLILEASHSQSLSVWTTSIAAYWKQNKTKKTLCLEDSIGARPQKNAREKP